MKNKKIRNKKLIGYTTGVFDLFHIGHLNILRNAKKNCDKLIVGVTTDELVILTKNKKTVIPFKERVQIVRSIKYVDRVISQYDLDKFRAWERLKYDVLFIGDDWKGNERWIEYEKKLKRVGAKIVYLPYTKNTSSTMINSFIKKAINDR